MKKGLYILIGIFTLILSLNSFVSAEGYCLGGTFSCYDLSESSCYNMEYRYGICSWDSYNNYCVGSGDCSAFDETSESTCETTIPYSSCTWQPGCLVDTDCGYGYYCDGDGGTCSGTYTYTTSTKVDWNGATGFDWTEGTTYFDGCTDCIPPYILPCESCGDEGNLGYRVSYSYGYNWYQHTCVENRFIICLGVRWSDGSTYLRSAYESASASCSGLPEGSCTPSGCTWNKIYGTCAPSCTDTCSSLGYTCGTHTICGASVNCGTCCPAGTSLQSGYCRPICGNGIINSGEECDNHTFIERFKEPYVIDSRNGNHVNFSIGGLSQTIFCQDRGYDKYISSNTVSVTLGDPNPYRVISWDPSWGSVSFTPLSTVPVANTRSLNGLWYQVTEDDYINDVYCSNFSAEIVGTNGYVCTPPAGYGSSCTYCNNTCKNTVVLGCMDTCLSLGYDCNTHTICGASVNCGTCTNGICDSGGKCVGYTCGDGLITGSETCDDGASNLLTGAVCTSYGGTCCSASCQTLTGPSCGDGVCAPADGETCSTCTDCACGTDYECSSGSCVSLCELTSASWNVTGPVIEGTPVRLNIAGTNCASKTVTFEVWEYDSLLGVEVGSDSVPIYPLSIVYGSPNTYLTWISEWQADNWPETDPPEYYFKAITDTDSIKSSTIYADMLKVNLNLYCGDGSIDGSETCDDGNTNNGDGCSSTCTIESGYTCTGTPSVCNPTCGNGTCSNGETCSSCPADCTWNANSQECVGGVIVPLCILTSASWNQTSAIEGQPVKLNIAGTNCDGKTITFEVMEKDNGLFSNDNLTLPGPPSINYNSPNNYTTWKTLWQDDQGGFLSSEANPPEYYFIASVTGTTEKIESSNTANDDPLLLNVYKQSDIDAICSGINQCNSYSTSSKCNADFCGIASQSVPSTITCGDGYNCGCYWDDSKTPKCNADWEAVNNNACTTSDECWLAGDLCQNDCTCFGTSTPNGNGACVDNTNAICTTTNECWLAGDLCQNNCTCEAGAAPNGQGSCGSGPACTTSDECWLAGDLCQNDCTCFGTSTPDGNGACVGNPNAVCTINNECWLAGDLCRDNCTCKVGVLPNGEGSCGGGTFPIGICSYTENSNDTCEGDNMLVRSLVALWTWNPENTLHSDPLGKSTKCVDISDTLVCPASVQVPFFGIYSFVAVIIIVTLIYILYSLKKKNSKKGKRRK